MPFGVAGWTRGMSKRFSKIARCVDSSCVTPKSSCLTWNGLRVSFLIELAVHRDGRRLDRTTTEDAVAIPMQVPSEYVSALEGLRPLTGQIGISTLRRSRLTEGTVRFPVGCLVSRLDWIQKDFRYQPHSCTPQRPNLSQTSIDTAGWRKLLGAKGLPGSNGDLMVLADALRAARVSSGEVPVAVTKYLASEPIDTHDPSLLVFEAWCRFGDRVVDPLLALRSGIQPLLECFPHGWSWSFEGDPSQPWFRRGRWTSSPVLNPNSR